MADIIVTGYRQASPAARAIIMDNEEFRAVAYDDKQPNAVLTSVAAVRGVPTIGWGHIRGVTALDIVNKRTISRDDALVLLSQDMSMVYQTLYTVFGKALCESLTQGQYDALVSFFFNVAPSKAPTLVSYIKAKRFRDVPAQMTRFIYSGGTMMKGLITRRRAEVDLWNEGQAQTGAAPAGSIGAEARSLWSRLTSRTVKASLLAGFTGVGTATTAAIGALGPWAQDGFLKTMLVTFVTISTISAFAAAALRAADQKGTNV